MATRHDHPRMGAHAAVRRRAHARAGKAALLALTLAVPASAIAQDGGPGGSVVVDYTAIGGPPASPPSSTEPVTIGGLTLRPPGSPASAPAVSRPPARATAPPAPAPATASRPAAPTAASRAPAAPPPDPPQTDPAQADPPQEMLSLRPAARPGAPASSTPEPDLPPPVVAPEVAPEIAPEVAPEIAEAEEPPAATPAERAPPPPSEIPANRPGNRQVADVPGNLADDASEDEVAREPAAPPPSISSALEGSSPATGGHTPATPELEGSLAAAVLDSAATDRPAAAPVDDETTQTLPGGGYRLLYEAGARDFSRAAGMLLSGLARRAVEDESLDIQIRAYASSSDGTPMAARQLSLDRAIDVRSVFTHAGVAGVRIMVLALGDTAPDGPPDRVDVTLAR